jgi:hypothetical protein
MSGRPQLDPQTVATTATIVAAVALALWLVLGWIARPHAFTARAAAAEARLDEADRLLANATGPLAHPEGSICHDAAQNAAAALKQRLQSAASANGLTAITLSAAPAQDAATALAPVRFSAELTGRYDQAVLFLGGLARSRPEVFVDQVDLKSLTTSVNLKVTGRLYCSTTANL